MSNKAGYLLGKLEYQEGKLAYAMERGLVDKVAYHQAKIDYIKGRLAGMEAVTNG